MSTKLDRLRDVTFGFSVAVHSIAVALVGAVIYAEGDKLAPQISSDSATIALFNGVLMATVAIVCSIWILWVRKEIVAKGLLKSLGLLLFPGLLVAMVSSFMAVLGLFFHLGAFITHSYDISVVATIMISGIITAVYSWILIQIWKTED